MFLLQKQPQKYGFFCYYLDLPQKLPASEIILFQGRAIHGRVPVVMERMAHNPRLPNFFGAKLCLLTECFRFSTIFSKQYTY
jgi:hypothetical protein